MIPGHSPSHEGNHSHNHSSEQRERTQTCLSHSSPFLPLLRTRPRHGAGHPCLPLSLSPPLFRTQLMTWCHPHSGLVFPHQSREASTDMPAGQPELNNHQDSTHVTLLGRWELKLILIHFKAHLSISGHWMSGECGMLKNGASRRFRSLEMCLLTFLSFAFQLDLNSFVHPLYHDYDLLMIHPEQW